MMLYKLSDNKKYTKKQQQWSNPRIEAQTSE